MSDLRSPAPSVLNEKIWRRAFTRSMVEEADQFCAAHPIGYGGTEIFSRTLADCVEVPDGVIDIFRGPHRRAFANVISVDTDSVLYAVLVGAEDLDARDWGLVAQLFVEGARAFADRARRPLRIDWQHPVSAQTSDILVRRGFNRLFGRLTMEVLASAIPPYRDDLPSGLRWVQLDETLIEPFAAMIQETFGPIGEVVPSKEMMRRFYFCSTPSPWGLYEADELVGVVHSGVRSNEGLGYLGPLCTSPNHRGRGIGALLVGKGLNEIVKRAAPRAELDVMAHNEQAIRLYKRFGFTEKCETSIYEYP